MLIARVFNKFLEVLPSDFSKAVETSFWSEVTSIAEK